MGSRGRGKGSYTAGSLGGCESSRVEASDAVDTVHPPQNLRRVVRFGASGCGRPKTEKPSDWGLYRLHPGCGRWHLTHYFWVHGSHDKWGATAKKGSNHLSLIQFFWATGTAPVLMWSGNLLHYCPATTHDPSKTSHYPKL